VQRFNNISNIYFLGIGGIGMSALARYFNENGIAVSGYDKTETLLTQQLVAEGIAVHYTDDISLADTKANLVVYTPAIPADHTELNYFKNNNYNLVKRSDVLGMATADTNSICIAGTHGKTTTSAMVAHILRHTQFGCNAFLGGIAANYDTNFWSSPNNVTVAEADEYDRSFLKLSPNVAVITAMDADHLDIYGTAENMEDAFISFSERIKPNGLLLLKHGLKRMADFNLANTETYSVSHTEATVFASNITTSNGAYVFTVQHRNWSLQNVQLNMGGMHNIENAIAAITIAKHLGISDEKIIAAVAAFKGVKRRFEYVIKTENVVVIDDYAHHPEELRALINGAKHLFPSLKCTVVFQPHLFSRTNDLADGFAEVLSLADETLLLPIYPARELPMPGVTSATIANKMNNKNSILEKQDLLNYIKNNKQQLLIISGAGDVDVLVPAIKNIIEEQIG
jgi:UDP-N-acetylmuramate--alanine ligase